MISHFEDYFSAGCGRCELFSTPDCATRQWAEGLSKLRRLCIDAGLQETVKWAHPCYMHAGRNIAGLGAFRTDFRLRFFNPALLQDSVRVLVKQGDNTRHPDVIRFTDHTQVDALASTIVDYLREAMGYAETGARPSTEVAEMQLPIELREVLNSDSTLAEAFDRLTPGRQRSYILHLTSAKQSATRVSRIHACRDKILAGKGLLER